MVKKRHVVWVFVLLLILSSVLPVSAQGYDPGLEISSKALYLINLDTDTVLYEKNSSERLPPASITKVMTYIVAYEKTSDIMNTVVTVSQKVDDELTGTGSSMSGIKTGEQLTVFQLLNLMMVPSGNDASLALAFYISEATGRDFYTLMNEKAAEIGCTDTNFVNPHGLHDKNHYSSAKDIALITKYAMALPYFMEITDKLYYTLAPTNKSEIERTVYSTNRMLSPNIDDGMYYYRYAKGIKTGSHNEAGYCLVSTASKDGYSYMCVALGSPLLDANGEYISTHGEMLDTRALYQWAFDNFEIKMIMKNGDIKGSIKVDYSWDKDKILLKAGETVSALLPKDIEISSIICKYDLPQIARTPIKEGDEIGEVTLSYADKTITTVKLLASESAEKSSILFLLSMCKDIFFANWITTLLFCIILLLLVYFLLVLIYNIRKNNRRKANKYANSKKYKYRK